MYCCVSACFAKGAETIEIRVLLSTRDNRGSVCARYRYIWRRKICFDRFFHSIRVQTGRPFHCSGFHQHTGMLNLTTPSQFRRRWRRNCRRVLFWVRRHSHIYRCSPDHRFHLRLLMSFGTVGTLIISPLLTIRRMGVCFWCVWSLPWPLHAGGYRGHGGHIRSTHRLTSSAHYAACVPVIGGGFPLLVRTS